MARFNGAGSIIGIMIPILGAIFILFLLLLPFLLIIGVVDFLIFWYLDSKAKKRMLEKRVKWQNLSIVSLEQERLMLGNGPELS